MTLVVASASFTQKPRRRSKKGETKLLNVRRAARAK